MKFLHFQSIVQYRIPINDDGSVGNPEILKKWTIPFGEFKPKKTKKKLASFEIINEVREL